MRLSKRFFKLSTKMVALSFMSITLLACKDSIVEPSESIFESIAGAAQGAHRSQQNIARNVYRHPEQTLAFFGLESNMTVIEISPGTLWYTEILAPFLKRDGRLIAAAYDATLPNKPPYQARLTEQMLQRFEREPFVFSGVETVAFTPPEVLALGADNSADMVLTFRNTHGWVHDGSAALAFNSFYKVLKPGAVLGLVQHRGDNRLRANSDKMSGYLSEATVIDLATDAGFIFEDKSEINANPKDTKDYRKGVWELPPVLGGSALSKNKHLAIGESDRMTLKFRKPLVQE